MNATRCHFGSQTLMMMRPCMTISFQRNSKVPSLFSNHANNRRQLQFFPPPIAITRPLFLKQSSPLQKIAMHDMFPPLFFSLWHRHCMCVRVCVYTRAADLFMLSVLFFPFSSSSPNIRFSLCQNFRMTIISFYGDERKKKRRGGRGAP